MLQSSLYHALGFQPRTEWNIAFLLHIQPRKLFSFSLGLRPTSAPSNKAGDANTGGELVDGDNRDTTCPHASLMSQLMKATSLLMLLQRRCLREEMKAKSLVRISSTPPLPFGHQFSWQCEWTPKKSPGLFIAVIHLPVSLLKFDFMEETWSLLYTSCQGAVLCLFFHCDIRLMDEVL